MTRARTPILGHLCNRPESPDARPLTALPLKTTVSDASELLAHACPATARGAPRPGESVASLTRVARGHAPGAAGAFTRRQHHGVRGRRRHSVLVLASRQIFQGGARDGRHTHKSRVPQLPARHRYACRARKGASGAGGREDKRERGRGRDRKIRVCVYYIQISIERERERGRERDTERYVCMCIIYMYIGRGEEGGTERYFHAPMRAHTHIHAHPLVPQCTHEYVYVAGGLCAH